MLELKKTIKTSDRINLRYRVDRSNKKKWMVFLHGFRVNSTVWTEYVAHFHKKGYSTLALDLRGHGQSGKPGKLSKYRLSRYTKDLEEILNKEKIPEFILVGYSMGGTIAMDYYAKHPEHVKALILISTSSELRSGMRKRNRVLFPIGMMILDAVRAVYSKFFKQTSEILDFSKLKNKDSLELLFEMSKDSVCRLNLPEFASIIAFNAKKALSKIKIPTLIIGGDSDELFSIRSFRTLSAHIKKSILKILKGTHCLVFVSPKHVIKEMDKFIQSLAKK